MSSATVQSISKYSNTNERAYYIRNAGNCGSIQRQPTSAATEDSRVARALDVAVRRVRIRRRTANVCVAAVTLVPIFRSGNAETLGRTGELTCFRCQAR